MLVEGFLQLNHLKLFFKVLKKAILSGPSTESNSAIKN